MASGTAVPAAQLQAVTDVLAKAKALPLASQKKIGSIVGACVADAASMPLHWVYDSEKMLRILDGKSTDIAFWPEPMSPFYARPTGNHSGYNDHSTLCLKSFHACGGKYDKKAYIQKLKDFYGPADCEYQVAYGERKKQQEYIAENKLQWTKPIEGPWIHGSVLHFLEAESKGKAVTGHLTLEETDGFVGSIPLVAVCAGLPDKKFQSTVADHIRILSASGASVNFGVAACLILRAMLKQENSETWSPSEFLDECAAACKDSLVNGVDLSVALKAIENVRLTLGQGHIAAVQQFGKACSLPGSFQGPLHAISNSQSFEEAVELTIRAGGCNCSRSNLIGAVQGARFGIGAIPVEWIAKTVNGLEVLSMSTDLFK